MSVKLSRNLGLWLLAALFAAALPTAAGAQDRACRAPVIADVVAIDQPYFWNRYGAVQPQGMMYALRRDVVHINDADGLPPTDQPLAPGRVMLRRDKRPRPLVLRVNAGRCLQIKFQNLLSDPNNSPPERRVDEEAPKTRAASIHVVGMQLSAITDDGSFVGANPSSVVNPGGSITYNLIAEKEGTYLLHSMGAIAGGEGDSGSISAGLFGAVNVEPTGSAWYRSQLTRLELEEVAKIDEGKITTMDYGARYGSGPYANLPILNMLDGNEIVHSDLTAIIVPRNPPASTKIYPDRHEPFREFTIIFHDEIGAVQAFPQFYEYELEYTLHSVRDAFAINYGTGGAGAEILANRLGVGPVWDCVECKYEEFFLTSWAVGDPSMVVDQPANVPCMVTTGNPNLVDKEPNYENKINRLKDGFNCNPTPGPKATKAFFPEDPSNVYHSYLNDNVKFRNLHAGSDDHHIFHLHAHQWLHTPNSDLSSYRDSQAIGQGAGYTYEIAYGGSGNRNKTVGDSIFHCHFYPHFAQGMWGLWRVHDVLELGTVLTDKGRPAANSRALPDGEIAAGTPIPAVVPMPSMPMAPVPAGAWIVAGQVQTEPIAVLQARQAANQGRWNPGYPFWVPGIAGHRPPHPPLDTLVDGGLKRHVVTDGVSVHAETRLDFHKDLEELTVNFIPEAGTDLEDLAMDFHALGTHPTTTPEGTSSNFVVNDRGRVRGAPMADPCPSGAPMRVYKAADIQMDVVLNKAGWHNPQQRLITLLEDIPATLNGTRPPEPLFFRAESGECIEFQLTNLVPNEWHLDDFQVRTPTDILGQHIHLVKFDVLASDGAGNGFNYEDGTFSGEEVVERLCAIRRAAGTCGEPASGPCNFLAGGNACPKPVTMNLPIPGYNPDCDEFPELVGAQTTVQRWWADPVLLNNSDKDRTLRTVFTHDHFGPSTHQQGGLYAGLIVERAGTDWKHNETGVPFGTRADGGPTSWQAVITNESNGEQFREFLLEFADFQMAYEPGGPLCPDTSPISQGGTGFSDPARAINPPGRKSVGPHPLYEKPEECPVNEDDQEHPAYFAPFFPPCPEAVSADDPGMGVVNYRNEPIALRVRDPNSNNQSTGLKGDLSFAYETRTDRDHPEFNVLPYSPHLTYVDYPALTNDLRPGDPFTPLVRAYEGDRVVVRTLVGAHEEEHVFTAHGLKWLFEPDWSNSGYRNAQHMGISEWFDFEVPRVPSLIAGEEADFLYKPSTAAEFQWTGMWGLLRVYRGPRIGTSDTLQVLNRQNPDARATEASPEPFATLTVSEAEGEGLVIGPAGSSTAEAIEKGIELDEPGIFDGQGRVRIACPKVAVPDRNAIRRYDITAVWSSEVLQNDGEPVQGLIYNRRNTTMNTWPNEPGEPSSQAGPLHDPTALMFVFTSDLDYSSGRPRLKQDVRREPLILRARAGECIGVTLRNDIPHGYFDLDGWNSVPMIIEDFNANDVKPSLQVGLHPQLVFFDIRNGDGANVGINPSTFGAQTIPPGQKITYYWYAGDYNVETNVATPIEFGSTNLTSSDPIKHANKSLVGGLIIEPPGATWTLDAAMEPHNLLGPIMRTTRASATVTSPSTGDFREFVTVFHDNVNLRYKSGDPVESLYTNEDPAESAQKGINYRTEPLWFRLGHTPDTPGEVTRDITNFHLVLSNSFIGGDPETQIFEAKPAAPTRFRLLMPEGHAQGHVFDLHGHIWEELPYVTNSTRIGSNSLSEQMGTRGGHGPGNHHEAVLINGAGGAAHVPGDYIYRDYPSWLLDDGVWGLLRVVLP